MKAEIPPSAQRLGESLLALMESNAISMDDLDGMIEFAKKLTQALQELRAKRMLGP